MRAAALPHRLAGWRLWAAFAAVAMLACLADVGATHERIATLSFPDQDDALRLQQVRDVLAGQSWFDATQYRLNPPDGATTHWSRLVDVPMILVVLLLRPLVGAHAAETAMLVAVPLLTLVAAMAGAMLATRRLVGPGAGLLAAAMLPMTIGAVKQLGPLRVDHHGWQIVLALFTIFFLVDPRGRRSGRAAGLCAAAWLAISLEGLPMVAAAGAVTAIRWALDPERERERFAGFAGTLALGLPILFGLTRPAAAWGVVACDGVSPVHLLPIGLAAVGAILAVRIAQSPALRWSSLAIIAAIATGTFVALAPVCASGAFAELDPLVRDYWYLGILEGMPIWRQQPATIMVSLFYPLVGIAGTLLGFRLLSGERRRAWAVYAALAAAASLVGIFVLRADGVAAALALPGGSLLLVATIARVRDIRSAPPRILLSAIVPLVLLPMILPLTLAALVAPTRAQPGEDRACPRRGTYAALDRLPAGTVLAAIEMGPGLILNSHHKAVASGHHRNQLAMRDTILTFTGDAATAREVLRRRRVAYVVACPDLPEMASYAARSPNGFWARLRAGDAPRWLVRVAVPGTSLAVWRVRL